LGERTGRRPTMSTTPVHAAIAREAPIEDLTRGTYGMADEGTPYLLLQSALASRQCGRCLGWSSTYVDGAGTSEPPNASPIPHHRSGFDQREA
jgi:hypothetical protein